nr:integrase, catalytic region, zinc finger, CCHC-type, peptidase aspartic, catalytic [Tanacetum cinerariifolium]
MTENRSRLMNFMKKFIGIVRFGNDHFGSIMGYEDYVIGDNVISKVYYVEGLGHNLFSIGQFCDSDLEVAFRKHSCYVRTKDGVYLLKGSWGSNLYTISVEDMMKSSPICLLSKASKNKSWVWHRRLNHLNFDTINDLARKDLICPKVPGQKLIDAPFKEEILVFMSNLGYPGNIKSLSEVKVEILPQPWRTFATIINKCLSAKTDQAPKAPQSKRLKATAKSKTQFYSSNSSGLGADEGTGVKPGVPDVPKYAYDDVAEGKNVKQEKLEEAKTNKGEEVNINLEGRDTKMTDASRTIAQTTQVIEDTHVTITPVNPEDVPVTIVAETPPSYATTLPPPPIPLITHMKQTPVPSPITVPSSSLQNLPNFGSLFRFDNRLKTLEQDFSEFKQTNQFAEAISSIPGIVDKYLANRMNDVVKIVVQLQSNRLREEAQAKNKTSSINLMKVSRKSSRRKLKSTDILDIYGDTVTIKRCRDDKDNNEEPSVGSDQGSKRRRAGKEPESTSSPKEKTSKSTGKSKEGSISHHKSTGKSTHVEEPIHTVVDLEEPTHQEPRLQIIGTSNGLKNWSLTQCGVKCQLAVTNMLSGEFHIRGENVNNSMDLLLTGNLLVMSTLDAKSSQSQSFRLSNGTIKNIWIGSFISLKMFTRSIVIQRRMEDLQLGDESYQKKLNIINPDTYQNKNKKNKLMRIDELYKFSDGTFNDVWTALDDLLKGIRMEYLLKTI